MHPRPSRDTTCQCSDCWGIIVSASSSHEHSKAGRLLVEPLVIRRPLTLRILQFQLKLLHHERNEFVDLTQRYLFEFDVSTSAPLPSSTSKRETIGIQTHVLPNTSPRPRPKMQHTFLHPLYIPLPIKPPLRPIDLRIIPENSFVIMHHRPIHPHPVPTADVRVAQRHPTPRDETGHGQPDGGVHPECLFDARCEEGELQGFGVFGWGAEGAGVRGLIDFALELGVC